MLILKIIFYGLLAMLERRPIFTIGLLALLILPPIYFEWVRWFYLGLLIFILLIVFAVKRKIRQLRKQFEQQYRDAMGGNAGAGFAGFGGPNGAGFAGFNFSQGMTLEDLVRQMQQQADARNAQAQQQQGTTTIKDNSSKTNSTNNNNEGEYVDFEEIK